MKIQQWKPNQRGIKFTDTHDRPCALFESSSAHMEAIWLGRDNSDRMHLGKRQIAQLIPHLMRFLVTGRL